MTHRMTLENRLHRRSQLIRGQILFVLLNWLNNRRDRDSNIGITGINSRTNDLLKGVKKSIFMKEKDLFLVCTQIDIIIMRRQYQINHNNRHRSRFIFSPYLNNCIHKLSFNPSINSTFLYSTSRPFTNINCFELLPREDRF